jgi:hypothetical protein
MSKSRRLIRLNAALRSVSEPPGVAELPQLVDRRNTKFGPDLVETGSLVRHRLSLESVEWSLWSEGCNDDITAIARCSGGARTRNKGVRRQNPAG